MGIVAHADQSVSASPGEDEAVGALPEDGVAVVTAGRVVVHVAVFLVGHVARLGATVAQVVCALAAPAAAARGRAAAVGDGRGGGNIVHVLVVAVVEDRAGDGLGPLPLVVIVWRYGRPSLRPWA